MKETDKHLELASGVADAGFMEKPLALTNESSSKGDEVKIEGTKVWIIFDLRTHKWNGYFCFNFTKMILTRLFF